MAFLSVITPNPKIYTKAMLHAVGRAGSDAEFRTNLRLLAAVLLAFWSDTNPNLSGDRGEIFDIATWEPFYKDGYCRADKETGEKRLWFCSYIGFEKITSEWAKKNHPNCHGYICMRLYNQDDRHNEMDSHTVQIYF